MRAQSFVVVGSEVAPVRPGFFLSLVVREYGRVWITSYGYIVFVKLFG